ncbi:MAG: hypothetical protein [Circular genetic element sp.]|nr:MAG: hypothetical protein [Circular genetic element sp.]
MPIHELRETIQGRITLDPEGNGYFTKRINLPDHMRNEILAIDCYNDNVVPWLEGSDTKGYQVYLSTYPVQRSNEDIVFGAGALARVGPMAGDDTVLYKESSVYTLNDFAEQQSNKIWTEKFPNDALGATQTSTFYSPHLYLTVLVWNGLELEMDLKYSIYAKIKQTKCSGVESSMGKYAEFLDAQCRILTSTAVMIPTNRIAGNTFPTWKFGGIRPELMISGATALRYFNRVASNANQDMIARGAFQTAYKESTKMQAFDSAFGDPTVPLPDWIQIMDVGGITSGVIRPFPPPLKFADNGNTLMF